MLKKYTLSLFFSLLGCLSLQAQVCTPDTTIKETGLYPRQLPDGIAGEDYNATMQFKFPKDTTYNGTTVPIDSVRIYQVSNMPSDFTYQCSNSDCKYAGGANGCGVFTGKPTTAQEGSYYIKITALAKVKFGGTGFWVPFTDSLPFTIKSSSGVFDQNANSAFNFFIQGNYPNPFRTQTEIRFNSPSSQTVVLRVYDMLGAMVYSRMQKAEPGENTLVLERGGLHAGLYLYSLQMGSQVVSKQMMIRD